MARESIPQFRPTVIAPAAGSEFTRKTLDRMSRTPRLCAGILSLLFAAALATSAQNNADERAVARLDREISAALARGDLGPLEHILADDYSQVSSFGQLDTKRQYLDKIRAGTLRFEQVEVKEARARVYGTAAVVNALLDVRAQVSGGRLDGPVRGLRVYVRRDGRWQCVAAQYTMVAPQAARGR
jgi:hypothetical protein